MSEIYKVSPLVGRTTVTVEDFNNLVNELNKVLSEIGTTVSKGKGELGATAKFVGNIDMDGHSITNVSKVNFSAREHSTGEPPFTGIYNVDDPEAAPADATALRNDLATNVLPDVEVALNDLGSTVRRILDVLGI